MQHDLEALKRRRAENGPMLSIYLGKPEGEEEEELEEKKLNDLAPEVKDAAPPMSQIDPEHEDEAQDMSLIKKMMSQMPGTSMASKMLKKK